MRKLCGLVLLVGCGPGFAGSWAGNLHVTAECTTGIGDDQTLATEWSITEPDGRFIEILPSDTRCGSIRANVSGHGAVMVPQICPDRGATTTMYSRGDVQLYGDQLVINLVKVNSSSSAACEVVYDGELTRQP